MRKVIMFNRISIDGYFAGQNGEIDWFIPDPELDNALHEMGQPGAVAPDTVLLGRVTYQLFESHWPKVADDPNAPKEARITADELNRMTKVVFSKTLKEASWENTKLVNGDVAEEVGGLKQEKGSDVLGKSLFIGVKRVGLELLESRNFKSGNVLLRYKIGK